MATKIVVMLGLIAISVGILCGQEKGRQNKDLCPGNPPSVLLASEIDADGRLVLVSYRTIFIQPAPDLGRGGGPNHNSRSTNAVGLQAVKIYGGDGKELSLDAARKRIGRKETAILATSHGGRLPATYQSLFRNDVLLFVFPEQAPEWEPIQAPELPVR